MRQVGSSCRFSLRGCQANTCAYLTTKKNTTIIRERLAQGTKPFVLRLSDGRTLPVPHPDIIAVGKRVIYLVGKNDRTNRIDPGHVVSIEEAVDFGSGSKR